MSLARNLPTDAIFHKENNEMDPEGTRDAIRAARSPFRRKFLWMCPSENTSSPLSALYSRTDSGVDAGAGLEHGTGADQEGEAPTPSIPACASRPGEGCSSCSNPRTRSRSCCLVDEGTSPSRRPCGARVTLRSARGPGGLAPVKEPKDTLGAYRRPIALWMAEYGTQVIHRNNGFP